MTEDEFESLLRNLSDPTEMEHLVRDYLNSRASKLPNAARATLFAETLMNAASHVRDAVHVLKKLERCPHVTMVYVNAAAENLGVEFESTFTNPLIQGLYQSLNVLRLTLQRGKFNQISIQKAVSLFHVGAAILWRALVVGIPGLDLDQCKLHQIHRETIKRNWSDLDSKRGDELLRVIISFLNEENPNLMG